MNMERARSADEKTNGGGFAEWEKRACDRTENKTTLTVLRKVARVLCRPFRPIAIKVVEDRLTRAENHARRGDVVKKRARLMQALAVANAHDLPIRDEIREIIRIYREEGIANRLRDLAGAASRAARQEGKDDEKRFLERLADIHEFAEEHGIDVEEMIGNLKMIRRASPKDRMGMVVAFCEKYVWGEK